jgi:hypothetical protein
MLVAAVALLGKPAAAATPSPSPSDGRSIAVSVPPDPVSMTPGHTSVVQMRVANPGDVPVRVTIVGRGLTLGDEGTITIQDGPDPLWDDNVAFPSGAVKVPANGYKDLSVTVHPPPDLSPDLYFVGFVVTPVPDPNSGVTVINQIGGYFTVDIPGPRDRRLAADLEVPGSSILGLQVHLGTQLDATLHVHNMGASAVQFWGETDTTTTGGDPGQIRLPKSLVPSSHERTFAIVTQPAWPIGFVHMHVVVIYPETTDVSTTQIEFARSVLVINPLVFVVLALIIAFILWRRVRARRRRRKGAHLKRARLKTRSMLAKEQRRATASRR